MIEHAKQFKPVFADKLAHLVCIISKQYNLFKPVKEEITVNGNEMCV